MYHPYSSLASVHQIPILNYLPGSNVDVNLETRNTDKSHNVYKRMKDLEQIHEDKIIQMNYFYEKLINRLLDNLEKLIRDHPIFSQFINMINNPDYLQMNIDSLRDGIVQILKQIEKKKQKSDPQNYNYDIKNQYREKQQKLKDVIQDLTQKLEKAPEQFYPTIKEREKEITDLHQDLDYEKHLVDRLKDEIEARDQRIAELGRDLEVFKVQHQSKQRLEQENEQLFNEASNLRDLYDDVQKEQPVTKKPKIMGEQSPAQKQQKKLAPQEKKKVAQSPQQKQDQEQAAQSPAQNQESKESPQQQQTVKKPAATKPESSSGSVDGILLEALRKEKDDLSVQNSNIQKDQQHLSEKIDNLEGDLQQLKIENEKILNYADSLKIKLLQTENPDIKVKILKNENDELKAQLQQQKDKIDQQLNQTSQNLADKNSQIQQLLLCLVEFKNLAEKLPGFHNLYIIEDLLDKYQVKDILDIRKSNLLDEQIRNQTR